MWKFRTSSITIETVAHYMETPRTKPELYLVGTRRVIADVNSFPGGIFFLLQVHLDTQSTILKREINRLDQEIRRKESLRWEINAQMPCYREMGFCAVILLST